MVVPFGTSVEGYPEGLLGAQRSTNSMIAVYAQPDAKYKQRPQRSRAGVGVEVEAIVIKYYDKYPYAVLLLLLPVLTNHTVHLLLGCSLCFRLSGRTI